MESLRSPCCQTPSGYLMLSSVNCKGVKKKKSNNPIFIPSLGSKISERIRVVQKGGPMHANGCRNDTFFHTALFQLLEKDSEEHTPAVHQVACIWRELHTNAVTYFSYVLNSDVSV